MATYTYFRRKFWAGPFYNAWIVAVLCIMAFLCGQSISNINIESNFSLIVICVFFGYANFVLSGYFKDIEADRATGYNTLPVVYGRKIVACISDFFVSLMVFSGIVIIILELNEKGFNFSLIPAVLFLAVSFILLTAAQLLLHKVKNRC